MKLNCLPDTKLFLIGNNSHLEDKRMVTKEMAEKCKNDIGFDLFMEASAQTGFNTQEIFIQAALLLYNDYIKYIQEELKDKNGKLQPGIKLENKKFIKRKKKKCL